MLHNREKWLNRPLNLRMFDNTQTTGSAGLSNQTKTFYEKKLIRSAEPNLVHAQFGQERNIPKGGGKSIEFRRYAPLPKALTPLTEGVTPTGQNMNSYSITATVAQYGGYVELSDVLDLAAIDPNVEEATAAIGSQAGRTLDTIVREVLNAGTNKMFAPSVNGTTVTEILLRENITKNCLVTPSVIRNAVAQLKRMNAPKINGDYVAVIHPDVSNDILGDANFIDITKYGAPERIYRGEIGKLYGVRFVETTEAKIIGPAVISDKLSRLTVKTAISASSTSVVINETLTAATPATAIPVYINGVANTITAIATADGETTLTVGTAITSLAAGAVICGRGAGKDGSAVYSTLFLADNAYGRTSINGGGLQHFIKQLGSAGSADPIDQRSTTGWKAMLTAEILVQEHLLRVESSSKEYGATAESN